MKKRGLKEKADKNKAMKNKMLIYLSIIVLALLTLLLIIRNFTGYVISSPLEVLTSIFTSTYTIECSDCGNGIFNACNKEECEKINKNCFFVKNNFPISNECITSCQADINCDSVISSYELQQYIKKWQKGYIDNKELMNAIKKSKEK